jgi:tetratricopeptide (TPR) repeat protein
LGSEHPNTANVLNTLAVLYEDMHEYAKAEPFNKEALRIRQKILGPEHPDTAESLNDLAALYQDMHEYVKAEPLYLEALRIRQKVLGPEYPDTATSLDRLAGLYRDMSKYAKAEPLYTGKRFESVRRFLDQNILTRCRASTIWPRCTKICTSTRAALPRNAPDPAEGSWSRTSRHGAEPQ